MKPGPRNLITDVPGFLVGNASDAAVKTGVTVFCAETPFTAGVSVMGGAPGTRETDLLAPDKTVQEVDALVLSGGSAFGLAAATGVADQLASQGRGFPVGPHTVPIVPAAILFDLMNGGAKDWVENPYPKLGKVALKAAKEAFDHGTAGAGTGATTANLKGGLGSASLELPSGHMVGALVAVNPLGSVLSGNGPHFFASPFEIENEFGGVGSATGFDPSRPPETKLASPQNTTIAIVATDAALDKAGCTRLATAAQDGIARAIWPSHTPMDGDLIFAATTNQKPNADPLLLGHAAALCLSRAIARGVFAATPAPDDPHPTWHQRFA